jgi:Putative prokaryotic signal transducing protein
MDIDEPVKVYDAWNSFQAHFLCNLLTDAGVAARVESTAQEFASGQVPFQTVRCPVWVAGADAGRARSIVAQYESALKAGSGENVESAEPYCYHCGQPVKRGHSRCPSCGLELDWLE